MSNESTPQETPKTTGDGENSADVTPVAVKQPEGEAPPVAGEPEDAHTTVLGQLEPNELAIMTSLNQQSRQMVFQIGQTEIQKQRLLSQLGTLEQQSHQQSQAIGKRLGIPDGTQWNVTPDGKVHMMQQPFSFPRPVAVPHQN